MGKTGNIRRQKFVTGIVTRVAPLLAPGEQILAAGAAILDEHPLRTTLTRSARTGFIFVVAVRPVPYVLTTSRLLLINGGYLTHTEIVGALDGPLSVLRERRGPISHTIVLRSERTSHTVPLHFKFSARRHLQRLLDVVRSTATADGRRAAQPVAVAEAPAAGVAVSPTHSRGGRRRAPWAADPMSIAENRQGRATPAQLSALRREGLQDALVLAGFGVMALGLCALGLSVDRIAIGAAVVAIACIGLAPVAAVRALRQARPGSPCAWAGGPVRLQLASRGYAKSRNIYRVQVGTRWLSHVGRIDGLVEGAGYIAYHLPSTGRIIAMERWQAPAGPAADAPVAAPAAVGVATTWTAPGGVIPIG